MDHSKILIGIIGLVLLGQFYMMIESQQQDILKLQTPTKLQYYENLVQEINNQNLPWKAKLYNRWQNTDLQLNQLASNYIIQYEQPLQVVNTINDKIPETFNATANWSLCNSIGEIRDQANCLSDYAFAAAEAISDRICIVSNQTQNPRISMENILTCCKNCGDQCNGGYVDAPWRYWVNTGIVSGDGYNDNNWCQPYFLPPCGQNCNETLATPPKCNKTCNPSYTAKNYTTDLYFGQNMYSVAVSQEAIQTEIMTNGPVSASMAMYEDFLTYQSGVYVHAKKSKFLGYRCVKILGWGVENELDYWYVANSWSNQWGENGFFKILRGYNECNIEAFVVGGIPKIK